MKKIIYKLALFLALISLLAVSFLTKIPEKKNENVSTAINAIHDTQFIIGAYDDGLFNMYDTLRNLLHFNTWHQFVSPYQGWNHITADNYLAPISNYVGLVTSLMAGNSNHNLRTIMSRPVITYVISGQRIDYQCESIPQGDPYWFWAYYNSVNNFSLSVYDTTDKSRYGSGEIVKCCRADTNHSGLNARWIVDSLRSNRELSFIQTDSCMRDNAWDWFVMPRIRIDSIYAAGTAHNEDTVCRIIITGWKGDIVKDIWLFIKNFKQSYQGIYNGNYLDTFHLYGSQDSLYIDTATINSYFLPPNNGNPFDWGNTCKMDIKIYWAGKVDTWFDRVRIENLPAHQYLTLQDSSIIIKIDTEIYWANNTIAGQIPNYFYFGECQFSHFPAIKELNKRIMTHSQNQNGITVDFNYPLFRAHIPGFPDSYQSNLTVEQLKKYLCEDDSLQRIIMASYPFGGRARSINTTVNISTATFSLSWDFLLYDFYQF